MTYSIILGALWTEAGSHAVADCMARKVGVGGCEREAEGLRKGFPVKQRDHGILQYLIHHLKLTLITTDYDKKRGAMGCS